MKREVTVAVSRRSCRKAGCHRIGDYSRGLCEPCYKQTARYVADGVISWKKLENQGKVAQPKTTLKDWSVMRAYLTGKILECLEEPQYPETVEVVLDELLEANVAADLECAA